MVKLSGFFFKLSDILFIYTHVRHVHIFFLQIANSVACLGIALPHPYPETMKAFSLFSLDFFPLRCLSSSYFEETYFWSAIPLLFVIIIVLFFAASASRALAANIALDRSRQLRHLFNRCMANLLLMTYLVLPPVSFKQYEGLACHSLKDKKFLRADTSIDCVSTAYFEFRRMNGVCIAIYSAITPMWLYLLWNQRRRLNPPTTDLRLAYHLRDMDEMLAHLRFLFDAYHPRFYYFEAIEM